MLDVKRGYTCNSITVFFLMTPQGLISLGSCGVEKNVMNPLSPKWVIELFLLLISFYRVSRVLTDDKYGEEAWLLVACSILQPICSLQLRIPRCPQVPRTGEQHLNSLADTGT